MPKWIVRSVERTNGLLQVHMSMDDFPHGQPEEIWMSVSQERFDETFMDGDERAADFRLIMRAKGNGAS